jgi:hypothetical protein
VKRVQKDVAKLQGELVWDTPKAIEKGPTATGNATEDPERQ